MATDLPFHNSSRSESTFYGGARLGRKKRYIVLGLIAAVFFVLWFSSDMNSNSVQQHSNSNEMAKDNAKDNTVLQDEVSQAKEEEDEVQDDAVIVESTTTTTKAKTAKAKSSATAPAAPPKETQKTTTSSSSIEFPKELPLIVETNHLKYFVVIASEANSFERRKLIRSSYFGMDNNVEPCMGSEKKGISYAFWLYGDAPQSKTPERRVYEAEKMEWFDLHQTTDAEFDQVKAMKWVS
jgi:hypothetical protein